MPNLVGIGNSQVPTNAMLGGLAYQDSVGEVIINKIKAKTGDTATDVFVYDTRKDSDGGAWRHRTQNTSWYNEGVSAKRGSRKEFPAVAVLVVTSSNMTIYDGDDPTLPMWMIFTSSNTTWLKHTTSGPNSVVALNGNVVTCGAGNAGRLSVVNFISDDGYVTEASFTYRHSGIITRNTTGVGPTDTVNPLHIVNINCNDVAITVLPNAPIDASTGLPVPTIAVATEGGVSVIRDNGTVDSDSSIYGRPVVTQIKFKGERLTGLVHQTGNTGDGVLFIEPLNEVPFPEGTDTRYPFFVSSDSALSLDAVDTKGTHPIEVASESVVAGGNNGLGIIEENEDSPTNGMIAHIAKDFNTGYQHGDIRGAFLSDTDTTNITGSGDGYVTGNDSTFGAAITSLNWSERSGSSGRWNVSGGTLNTGNPGPYDAGEYLDITLPNYTAGQTHVITYTLSSVSGTKPLRWRYNDGQMGNLPTSNGFHAYYVTLTESGTLFSILNDNNLVASIDNFKIQLISDDNRSLKSEGLIAYGTITKSAVATGAELVSYDSLSSSNYLEQPYNSDLDFGTGDFCMMGWFYNVGTSASILYRLNNSTTAGVGYIVATSSGGELGYSSYTQGFRSTGRITHYTSDTWNGKEDWNMFVCGKKGGYGYMYVNGVLKQTGANANSHTDTTYNPPLRIGNNHAGNGGIGSGKLALIRISSGFPSDEQIKKIYNDEKCLFHENAKCTLYGTSDDVKALAYDDTTDVLHVGTSGGRSEFQGLNRINNTTTAVTTAISASTDL